MHAAVFPLLLIAAAQEPERIATDTIVFPAGIAGVWAAFTEPAAIGHALGVSDVRVELLPGGRIAWSGGDSGLWSQRQVLAHETQAMLAFAFEPPAGTDERIAQRASDVWSVLYLAPLAFDRTEVVVTTVAQGTGEDFGLAAERYADEARAWVAAVQESFETSAASGTSALAWAAVNDWVGGEWIAQRTRADGKIARECVQLAPILGGQFLLEEFWSGDERALRHVTRSIYGLDPQSRGTRCWTFAVDGTRSESTLRWEDDALVLRDASSQAAGGVVKRIRSDGPNAHAIETLVGGARVDAMRFERVETLPGDWKLVAEGAALARPVLDATSEFVPPDLQRTTGFVDASASQIWSELTSSESLARLWNVAHASIEPRIGGHILTHYDPAGTLGDAGGIRHEILALDPGRMLAFRTRPPEGAPEFLRTWCATGWHVLRFDAVSLERVKMTTTGCNYAADATQARDFFARGNEFVQAGIAKSHASSGKARDVLERLTPLLDAEYDAQTVTPDGESLRARTRWSRWCGPFVAWEGRLGTTEAAELADHTLAIYGSAAERGPWFWKFGADGSVASGGLVAAGDNGVGHDWHSHAIGGQMRHIYVQVVPEDRDYSYRAQPSPAESTTLVSLEYVRR